MHSMDDGTEKELEQPVIAELGADEAAQQDQQESDAGAELRIVQLPFDSDGWPVGGAP